MSTSSRVSNPPPKPLMIWDGDCHFCRMWIERWRVLTAGQVDYTTSQEAAGRFPEIPLQQFQRSVVFIQADGAVFVGAEAVFRSLQVLPSRRWLAWTYDHVPGFAAVTELGYRFVAQHRSFSSAVTRFLWGEDVRPPTYFWARRWFLRFLALSYATAFLSLWVQMNGLFGANGILPINQRLPQLREQLGGQVFLVAPSLCWFNASDVTLHFLCAGGVVLALLLILEIAPVLSLIGLFVLYLSLTAVGAPFLDFQWDILLLETGFLAIFFAPWKIWPKRGDHAPGSRAGLFLLKLLLFKLMLMSGVVKLTSGDDSWWNLTALDYHYWSQPLPTIFAWWADQHPEWFKKFSVAFCLFVEIVVPFFIWTPRRPRLIAFGLLVFLQLAIGLTGNYCFFNLLTIALCLLLIDDVAVKRRLRSDNQTPGVPAFPAMLRAHPLSIRVQQFLVAIVFIVTLPLNAWHMVSAFQPMAEWPAPLRIVYEFVGPFRMVNGYGLFRVMTKDRFEIILEGSGDGIEWRAYEFKWKPGEVRHAPGWCAPHQPRLDWQMWFAALGGRRERPWFVRLAVCLLEGKSDVIKLLDRNPFPDAPPRYIRAEFYRYRFTNAEEHRQSGAWWKRQEIGEYLPALSLDQLR